MVPTTSLLTGKAYAYDLTRKTRTEYAEFMNASTRYTKVYFQVNVYIEDKLLNFGFVENDTNFQSISDVVHAVIEWDETPGCASMSSRFD